MQAQDLNAIGATRARFAWKGCGGGHKPLQWPQACLGSHFLLDSINFVQQSCFGYNKPSGFASFEATELQLPKHPYTPAMKRNSKSLLNGLRLAGLLPAALSCMILQRPVRAEGEPASPPRIISTTPQIGAEQVDPSLSEITVTFDHDMASGFSWTGGGPFYPRIRESAKPVWRDKRTCVLPVVLERGAFYRVGINSKSHRNFRGANGIPVLPTAIYFATQGADDTTRARLLKPVVMRSEPANGAVNVSPSVSEIRVTFNVPMGGGFSWTGGGENYPEIPEGQRPHWTEDRMTCVLPVRLKPNWTCRLSLNSASAINFQSESGVPLERTPLSFATGSP
jgi:hypothetical protein